MTVLLVWAGIFLVAGAGGCVAAEGQEAKQELFSTVKAPPAQGWRSEGISFVRTVRTDLTVPANVCLKFEDGGMCDVEEGATLTINGPLEAPLAQIFRGHGKVFFGPGHVKEVYPQWWGARSDDDMDDTAAIQAAIDSRSYQGRYGKEHVPPNTGGVFFPVGRYMISARLTFYAGSWLEGATPDRTELQAMRPLSVLFQRPDLTAPADGKEYNYDTRVTGLTISKLTLNGRGSEVGLDLTNVGYSLVENVMVRECKTGILLGELAMHNTLLNTSVGHSMGVGIDMDRCSEHCTIFGGRISDGEIGLLIRRAQGITVYGMSFEGYKTTGVDVRGGDSVNLDYLWFATSAPAAAIRIAPELSGCVVVNPRFHGATPQLIVNQAKDTLILSGPKEGREKDIP